MRIRYEVIVMVKIIIVAVVLLLIAIGCGPTRSGGTKEMLHGALLANVESPADGMNILEMSAIFRVVDTLYWDNNLKNTSSPEDFDYFVRWWQKKHQAHWQEIDSLLTFCRKWNFGPAHLDERIKMVLLNGQFKSEWIVPSDCGDGRNCRRYAYSWERSSTWRNGKSVVCESEVGSDSVSILQEREVAFKQHGGFWPFVLPMVTPGWSGGAVGHLKVGVTVPGDQFTQATLDSAVVTFSLKVFERNGKSRGRLVATDSTKTDLQSIRATMVTVEEARWKWLGVPGYLNADLPPGEYGIEVQVRGAERNESSPIKLDIVIEEKPIMGDLFLIQPVEGRGLDTGVTSLGSNFYPVSRPEFVRGKKIRARVEFRQPEGLNGYTASVSMIRIPDYPSKKKGTVEVFPITYWEYAGDGPVYETIMLPEWSRRASRSSRDIWLLDTTYAFGTGVVVFDEEVCLNAPPGKYFLIVQILSADEKHIVGTRAMVISIVSQNAVSLSSR